MTIINLIEPLIAALNTNGAGDESNAPLFLYGTQSYQNIQDDANVTYGIAYLDEPMISQDTLHTSGYLEEKYPLGILFGFKSTLDAIPTQERIHIDAARELRRRFINILSLSPDVRRVENIRTTDVLKKYDLNITGCFLQIDVTPLNPLENCLPDGTVVSVSEEEEETPLPELPGDALIYMNDDEAIPIETRWSAAIIANDIPKLQTQQLIDWSAVLGFQNYHGTMRLNIGDTDDMKAFADAVGARLDVFFSARLYNTTTDVDTYYDECDPEFFQIDGEVTNDIDIEDYKTICAEVIARLAGKPTPVRVIIWTNLAYKLAPATLTYNIGLKTITGAENGTQYFQMSDLLVGGLTDDMDLNLEKFEQYFSSTPRTVINEFNLQGQYNRFFSEFTNVEKLACVQMHPEDAGVSEKISNTPMSHWAIGRMMKFVFEHTDKISYLCWMAWGNLFQHNTRTQEYYSCQLYSQCFTYTETFTVDFGIEGVEGVGFKTGNNYALCITNKRSTTHTVTQDQIGIALGVTIQGDFTRKTRWATSWNDGTVGEEVTETDLTIRKFSGSLIEFEVA